MTFDEELAKDGLLDNELFHEGVIRKSGRYPWGSGANPGQRSKSFLMAVEDLKKQGLTDSEIAKGLGITNDRGEPSTTRLRALKSIAKNEKRAEDQATARRLRDERQMSNVAIGKQMNINESSVRALLDEGAKARNDELGVIADMLKDNVDRKGMIDIGEGVENHIGVASTKLNTAVAMLEEQGYNRYRMDVEQLGTGKKTNLKVLAKPEITYGEAFKTRDQIQTIDSKFDNDARAVIKVKPPENLSSKRVKVRYAEEGGADKDGVIELRRGVDDVSLGKNKYAQVRVAVDGTHYLKGMAMYSDNMPDGVDVIFNTNKSDTGNKLDAMKKMNMDKNTGKLDVENPFGAVIKPGGQQGKLNIVNEEGDWGKWSKSLSSQMLSKQPVTLAKQQLDLKFKSKMDEFDEINNLTNPAVKKKLLEGFADDADSSAVHLKAAALPRQGTHAILPINSLKDTEIYAPKYKNGESVVLIRYPHGGIFEIPELKVNNRNKEALSILKDARDAVGINSRVAERLSGADFDGDTVLVIPNNNKSVKTRAPLKELEGFDPKKQYPKYEGMPKMSAQTKQAEMGKVSNLITDMTIGGASWPEIARAVKHSMVVIDAEKHNLNYKLSAKENGIAELKKTYQGKANAGATTLISRASSDVRVAERKQWSAAGPGSIDAKTGEKVYRLTGDGYTKSTPRKDGSIKEEFVQRTTKSKKMAETNDARTLISDGKTSMEMAYADHANKLKALANRARKEYLVTPAIKASPSAKKAYKNEVDSLNAKLDIALRNKPLERKAQLLANAQVTAKKQANPDLDKDQIKKLKGIALTNARIAVGAEKTAIVISPKEWEAIQAGAITNNRLNDILKQADMDQVKALATPRTRPVMTDSKIALAKARLASGNTLAEVADSLGIPTSTLVDGLG